MDNKEKTHKDMVRDHLGNQYKSVKEMCEHYGLEYSVFYQRYVRYGWDLEKALLTPVRKNRRTENKEEFTIERMSRILTEAEKEGYIGYDKAYKVTGRYPSKEFEKYLLKGIESLKEYGKSDSLGIAILRTSKDEFRVVDTNHTISVLSKTIEKCRSMSLQLMYLDYIYIGEEETVKELTDNTTYQELIRKLSEPEGLIKEIYVNFTGFYGISGIFSVYRARKEIEASRRDLKKSEYCAVQPESPMEEGISLARANRIYNIDRPLKWYPSQEYIVYLEEQKKKLKNLPSMIQAINEKIRSCKGVQHFLGVMDLIYLGEEEIARSTCGEDTFRMSKQLMEDPEGMIKEIYVDYVSYRKHQAGLKGVALV